MIYLLIIILLVGCVISFELSNYKKNNTLCYWGLFIIITCVAGFRYRLGIDTIEYMRVYDVDIPVLSNFIYYYKMDLLPHWETGFTFFLTLCKTINNSWFFAQFTISLVANIAIFTFAHKHTKYKFTFILLYCILLYFDLNYETLRQSLALSISLYAFDALANKSYIKYFILVGIAITFHIVACALLIIPFLQLDLNKKNLSIITIISFIICIFFYNYLWELFPKIINMFDNEYLSQKSSSYFEGSWALNDDDMRYNWKGYLALFFTCPLQNLLLLYAINQQNMANKKYLYPFLLLWCILLPLQKIIPISYRIIEFIYPFLFLIFAETIIDTFKHKFSYKHISIIILFTAIIFPIRIYQRFFKIDEVRHTLPRIVSCYPYANIFTKERDLERESFYNEVGR